jgi:hypothetical protein
MLRLRFVPALCAVLSLAAVSRAGEPLDAPPKLAPNRIVAVTVYPNSALVTREVDVPEGVGSFELVVSPLPTQTVNSSLYTEGTEGLRILTTRYRMRPIKEDTREEVRKLESQLKQLQQANQKLASEAGVIEKNMAMLAKLEDFTGTSLKSLTEKGLLNGDQIILLSKYVMESRSDKAQALVVIHQQQQDNAEQLQFVQRKLQETAAHSSKIERDAVIVVDKRDAAAGKVRLNYLVDSASWRPQYKLRADKQEKKPVGIEYLAAVVQQSGEDWNNARISLSTAQPMLSALPPDLKVLEVAVMARGAANPANPMLGGKGVLDPRAQKDLSERAMNLRGQAVQSYTKENKKSSGDVFINDAAALEQTSDLLVAVDDFKKQRDLQKNMRAAVGEGPSITYDLPSKLSIPSRNDEQVIEIARLEVAPQYYYKAVPVLTNHVYRLADLTNTSKHVLLPGEATMYIGTDFVGRAELPLVAVGEQFTAGFGVDPQLQVQRQLLDKTRTNQGDNQVWKYEYRVLVSSYKSEPVKVQLWDRLPHADNESVAVSLVKTSTSLSTDSLYLRESRPNNLLRWDLTVEPGNKHDKALAVNYEFKLELGRQMTIGNILAK